MNSPVPMILPKGIVVNTDNIYKEVESFSTIPMEKICEYWHVYTTTNKRLEDPTARRLENFWWQVWGSDRRLLNGRTLAKLYEDISLGPTFVPLRGPANRWEGPATVPPNPEAKSQSQVALRQPSRETTQESEISPKAPLKSLSSSASKPPPSHPILKKARGPSSTGPRPTARFAFPEEPAQDEGAVSESVSSGSTVTAASEIMISVPSPAKKKAHGAGRKFVASKATSKRRPALARRQSSQSSTASEGTSREGGLSAGSRSSVLPRAVSPIPEAVSRQASPDSKKVVPVVAAEAGGLSAKAAGKRPAMTRRTHSEMKTSQSSVNTLLVPQDKPPARSRSSIGLSRTVSDIAPSNRTGSSTSHGSSTIPGWPNTPTYQIDESAIESDSASSVAPSVAPSIAPAMVRSLSSYEHFKGRVNGRPLTQGLFTGATASTTPIAAQGTIIDQSGIDPFAMAPTSPYRIELPDEEGQLGRRPSETSLLDSRFTPTLPTTSTSVPLGRTRSQLTLLLEREKARVGEKPRSKS